MKTEIKVSAEGIQVLVNEVYPDGVEGESSIEVNAREISSKVSKNPLILKQQQWAKVNQLLQPIGQDYTTGRTIGIIILMILHNYGKKLQDGTIYSAFEQTATGFNLSGNVRIDGNTVITENLKLSGTVTWDMNNSL